MGVDVILSITEIQSRLFPLFEGLDVKKAILFGSYARNQETVESDIDLVIDSEMRGLDFIGVKIDVEETLGRNVDLIPERSIDKTHQIYRNILNEGVIIYEQS